MSSPSSYSVSYPDKGTTYVSRSSSPRSATSSSASSSQSRSIYANSAQSSRNHRYANKPPIVHNGGGTSNDTNTSTSAPNSGYYN
ncbi:hypothetical protein K504DRAFT_506481 [Pleomassaria siparia CBS 279.74]|uniref:Uncharacterized protein n=1 Tax=Pleomassaria siparia CBS 279.74 TaxID=1314801 RepID=A0A6G1JWN0_9PLEO|nr:hypothetical protein K504DRAFT_506481 [Pleomassaria siparia CBS 279.74]